MSTTAIDESVALTTLTLAAEFLGENVTSTSATATASRVRGLINNVSERANSRVGRHLRYGSYDEVYDGNGLQHLRLRHYPIQSDSTGIAVYIVSNRDDFSSTTDFDSDSQVDGTDIFVDSSAGIIEIKDDTFTAGRRNVRVVYTGGYGTTASSTAGSFPVPGDLEDAVHQTIAFEWQRQTHRAWATRTISHDDGSVSYYDSIPQTAIMTLDKYRVEDY